MSATPNAPAPDTTPATAPAEAGEEQALLDLHAHDQPTFEYAPWRDTGQTGSQRLYEIQKARAAQQQADASGQAEQPDADATTDDLPGADDIDLSAEPDDAGEGEKPAEGDEPEQAEERTPLEPWQPPEGQEIAEHAKPVLAELDGIATDEGQRDKIMGLYQKALEAQTARLAEMDKAASKETAAALTERLGSKEAYDGFFATAREGAKLMPKPLRDALKTARLPDGRKVAHMPELVEFLHQVAGRQGQATSQPQDRTAMLQEELSQIDHLMRSDISEYHRPNWRNTARSASDRRLEIMRQLDSPDPNPRQTKADLEAEKRELVALRNRDEQMFRFGDWRGSGRPAADRLAAIQAGRG